MDLIPITLAGNLYKFYLKHVPNHFSKIRFELFLGKKILKSIRFRSKDEGIVFQLESADYITREILKHDMYESESIKLCKSILKESGGMFVDVGANFGLYTCMLSKYYSKCISIDASPSTFSKLINHINNNNLEEKIVPIISAVSSHECMLGLALTQKNNNGTNRISESPNYYIQSSILQNILHKFAEEDQITLMKIDIEGHEYECLSGLNLDSKYSPKNILMEYEPLNGENTKIIIEMLRKHNYEIYNIKMEKINRDASNILESNILAKKINV